MKVNIKAHEIKDQEFDEILLALIYYFKENELKVCCEKKADPVIFECGFDEMVRIVKYLPLNAEVEMEKDFSIKYAPQKDQNFLDFCWVGKKGKLIRIRRDELLAVLRTLKDIS